MHKKTNVSRCTFLSPSLTVDTAQIQDSANPIGGEKEVIKLRY